MSVIEVASYYCYYYNGYIGYKVLSYCSGSSYYYTNCCRYSSGEPLWEIIMWCSIACILIVLSIVGAVIRNKRRQAMYNQMAMNQAGVVDSSTTLYGNPQVHKNSSSSGKKRNHYNAGQQ